MSLATSSSRRHRRPPDLRFRLRRRSDPGPRRGSGESLEQIVLRASRELEAGGRASCPVCAADELRGDGCRSCGSELSTTA